MGSADTLALGCALLAGGTLRAVLLGAPVLPKWVLLLIPAWWIGASVFSLLPGWGLSAVDHLRRQVTLITTLFGFGAVLMFFTKAADTVSRLSIGVTWGLSILLVPFLRLVARHLLCKYDLYGVPTIIFGRASVAANLVDRLRGERGLGYFPVGICTDDQVGSVNNISVLGGLDTIMPAGPAAIVASSGLGELQNREVINRAFTAYRNVMIVPDLGDVPSLLVVPRDLSGRVGLEISQTLLSPFAPRVKRAIDVVLVSITMPFWLPLCAAACVAVWLEDGRFPIYKQKRAGRDEEVFFAYKCRTMVPNADKVLAEHLERNPDLRAEWEQNFKLREDPRITRIGKFLRRTSLDELPQLFNVLLGDMALVGPRPLPDYHLEELGGAVRDVRSRMRPGLTGLWQVSGRSDTGNEGMRRWDQYYVRNWSIWFDIVILVRTFRAVVRGSGAR